MFDGYAASFNGDGALVGGCTLSLPHSIQETMTLGLTNSYAIWNNKGGVGKSTITFHVASLYAETHPDVDVLVVDMCPQANASMMLLGGGTAGEERST